MTIRKAELLEIIQNGEGSGIEFKCDDIRAESLAKEIVALANFKEPSFIADEDRPTVKLW